MGKSIEKTDIYGDKYTVHYDDDGKKIGESRTKTDIYGDAYIRHVNADGDKIGESRARTDIYGDAYVQHTNSDSQKTGESWTKTDVYGDRYVQHLDDDGAKLGESRTKTDIYGDRYAKHTGDVPYQQSRQARGANDPSSTSESSDGISSSGTYSDLSSGSWSGGSVFAGAASPRKQTFLSVVLLLIAYVAIPLTMAAVVEHQHIEVCIGKSPMSPAELRSGAFLLAWPLLVVLDAIPAAVEILFWLLSGRPQCNTLFEMVALASAVFWLFVGWLARLGLRYS